MKELVIILAAACGVWFIAEMRDVVTALVLAVLLGGFQIARLNERIERHQRILERLHQQANPEMYLSEDE